MPRVRQVFGTVGTIRNFVNVVRELSIDDIRTAAETPPRLLVLAPDESAARQLADRLTGQPGDGRVEVGSLLQRPETLERYDAIVVLDPERTGRAGDLRRRLKGESRPGAGTGDVAVFALDGVPDDEAAVGRVRQAIVRGLPERAPALGRAFPAFRPAAVKALTDETAKANAQFAAVSNIPAVVPIVGGLVSAGADFLVLTKNQLLLLFKIAAVHDRDLRDQVGILREMVPVVGAGLFWRTLAREAASFVPFAAGTIPKVAIAYIGTAVAGRAADYYYRFGRKPSRDELSAFYRQAAEVAKRLPVPGKGEPAAKPTGSVDAGTAPGGIGEPPPPIPARTET